MGAFTAMAWNGFREARRNRVTVLVGAFALVLLFATTLVTEVTVSTFDRVVTDFGLGVMSLLLVFLSIYLSSGLLSREIERRTIFLMVSKPMSRSRFLLARLAGNMLTLGVLLVAMTLLFWLQLVLNLAPITQPQLAALWGLYLELFVLTSAGFLLSTFASQLVSALVTTGLYFAGHLSADIYNLGTRSKSELVAWICKATYYALPNLERLNFRPRATYVLPVAASELATATLFALGWGALFCVLATLVFERRDFR
ncbi:ABC transporter permease [Pyxidicoccus caerfyrddinensis]|jgi:ABC-type transport system involved in multi-copper enzyme maturation permease subunit|uniref:ABC transporter permease n=1 Tax=Pyxidicoccus caerfyrddinensis TaxID=2709663 RepID=UPI0013DD6979|nr:ABC transporter permease subunit [Pyxidicoccus caerfyrddinensis]